MPIRELGDNEDFIPVPSTGQIRELAPDEKFIPLPQAKDALNLTSSNGLFWGLAPVNPETEKNFAQNSAGINQGLKDVVLTGERGLNAAGIAPDFVKQDIANKTQQTKDFEASDEGKSPKGQMGRMAGQQFITLPAMLGAGAAFRAGAGAIGPTLGRFATWLTGGGGTVSNALAAGEARAANNALTYGASNKPFGEYVKEGVPTSMAIGGAARFVPAATRTVGTIANALTEGGQNRLANQIITRAADSAPALTPYSPIPGVERTLPEAIPGGSPGVSGLYRTLHNDPIYGPLLAERAKDNAAARLGYFQGKSGNADDLAQLVADRAANEAPAINQVFQPGQYSDTLPVIQKIDGILSGESGKRPGIRNALEDVRRLLIGQNQAGITTLESDPALLYNSVRKHIDDILNRRLGANSPPVDTAMSKNLLSVKNELDNSIESGAPGFQQAINDYAEASKPIGQMQFLQGLNVTDASGNLTLDKVGKALDKARNARIAPGANNAKNLTNEQMQALENLHEDLLAANQVNQGRALGSNTTQNFLANEMLNNIGANNPVSRLVGNPRLLGTGLGIGAGHVAAGLGYPAAGYTVGPAVGGLVGDRMANALATRNERIRQLILDRMLNPNLYEPRLPPQPNNDLMGNVGSGALRLLGVGQ